jgi:hypothetical protein
LPALPESFRFEDGEENAVKNKFFTGKFVQAERK